MPDALLEPVGFGAVESAVYLCVLAAPQSTTAQLAAAAGSTPARIRPCLRRLTDAGLIARLTGSPPRYTATPPEISVDTLVASRKDELDKFRTHAHELAVRFQKAATGAAGELIELIDGPTAIRDRLERMQLGAQREMKVVDCPPYFDSPVANPIEFQLLRRGVDCQVIYDTAGLEGKRRMDFTMACIAAGEQARSLPSLQMKMLIADRRVAMIPLTFGAARPTSAIMVHDSPLLTTLLTCFDLLWERAVPITATETANSLLDQRDLELLTMLAGGAKDAAIIRALGITQRTMTRRIHHILTALDAKTRFQAGLQAARRGWL